MNLARLWTIARLELLQRVRTISWYVLLGLFACLLVLVTVLAYLSYGGWGEGGPGVYSTVVYLTLLLVLLVSPTFSGNSINGDRDAATLAPVQVTLATTGEILLGKFVAAWVTGLTFAAVAVPFLIIATLSGNVLPWTVVISVVILVVETGIVAACGVAISGILARPLFSVAVTYLVVAALALGSVIGFGLLGSAMTSKYTSMTREIVYEADGNPQCKDGTDDCWSDDGQYDFTNIVCGEWRSDTYTQPRFDRVWWMLTANPFVILADATPTTYRGDGYPDDMFGWLKYSVRATQIPPESEQRWDGCSRSGYYGENQSSPTPQQIVEETVPSWFVGLALQLVLAVLLMWWAWLRTRTPSRTLPPGTRIA